MQIIAIECSDDRAPDALVAEPVELRGQLQQTVWAHDLARQHVHRIDVRGVRVAVTAGELVHEATTPRALAVGQIQKGHREGGHFLCLVADGHRFNSVSVA